MGHVPHLHLPGPWPEAQIPVDDGHRRHLERVLRLESGDPVSYTDGEGISGSGSYRSSFVVRGVERREDPPHPHLTLAVAPPAARDRTRFMVEKLAELGVRRIHWLRARHGEGRPPNPSKARAWASAALEQSRGAWSTEVEEEMVDFDALERPLIVAVPGASSPSVVEPTVTLAIGPEGGWQPEEIPKDAVLVSLGPRILRVETAAIAAAARLLVP